MKSWRQSIFSIAASYATAALLFSLMFAATSVSASEISMPIPTVWEQRFGDDQYSYESKAALVAPSGMLIVAGVYSPMKNRSVPEGGWIWRIDESGKKIADLRFNGNILGSTLVGIDAFQLVGNDVVAIAGRLSNGKSFLIHIDSLGNVTRTMDLGNRWIARLIKMRDESLVLAGQKNGDMLLMKLDKSGAVTWEKVTNRGKDDSLVDGNVIAERLLLVELSGKQEQFSISDSMIGLVKPAIDGEMPGSIFSTKGRSGSLAHNSEQIILVYDAATTGELDMRFVLLDKKYRVIRKASIIKGKIAIERFRVGRVGKSGFIAVGTLGGKMVFTFIDKLGQIKWQHTRLNNEAFFLNPEIVGENSVYVVSTMMVLTSDKRPKTLVNILKVDSNHAKH